MKSVLMAICLSLCLAHVAEEKVFQVPPHFPAPVYDFDSNPLDSAKIALGRMLFYDPILSENNTISCASCHSSYNAFAHTDHALSHGIFDSIGQRNAPPLFNLAWQSSFHWDGAIHNLDVQALAPINHKSEMGTTTAALLGRLNNSERYKPRFSAIFHDTIITTKQLTQSLGAFIVTLVSANAKYDKMIKGEVAFTDQENNGYAIYKKHCSACHTEPIFTNTGFASNGLSVDAFLRDVGRGKVTQKPRDDYHFKVPSLRNLSYTYPYMHDGRFKRLRQVVQHYLQIDTTKSNLSPELRHKIDLSSNEQTDLIAFLLTLDDETFVRNKKFAYPTNEY